MIKALTNIEVSTKV